VGLLADDLVDRLDLATHWPIDEDEREARTQVERWVAFRENDREALKTIANWQSVTQPYRVDPLAERISGAFASLLFGREPKVKVAEGNPQDRMDDILRENRWGSRLRSAEETCSSEGEVWWRVVADPARFDQPMLTWHSRLDVVPHYVAQRVGAVAFISRLEDPDGDEAIVWRHFEVHDDTTVRNVLYRGGETRIGVQVELTAHPLVEELAEEWEHDTGMMAGRIVNVEGTDPTLGKSDYDGIEDHLLELNECFSTGAKNRGLTALQRAYGPESAVDETGALPEGQNFLAVDDSDMAPGMTGPGEKFGVLNFTFDAEALIKWWRHVAQLALSRRGITPQFTGDATDAEGYAQTGVALRMRLIPSTNEGDRRASPWRDEADNILLRLQQIDARPESERGFGQSWPKVDEAPAVTLGDALPVDEIEDSTRLSTLRSADAISIRQAVIERNPDWDEKQVDEEVERINQDRESAGGGLFGRGPQAPADENLEPEDVLPEDGETVELAQGVSVSANGAGFVVTGLPAPE
jgi:hypothetical protein